MAKRLRTAAIIAAVILGLMIISGAGDVAADIVLGAWHGGKEAWFNILDFFRELGKG